MDNLHRNLHRVLMGGLLIATLAVAVGVLQPTSLTAQAQDHGHQAGEPAEHFAMIADMLELDEAQKEELLDPMTRVIANLDELAQLHGLVAAQLTDTQKEQFTGMLIQTVTERLGAAMPHHGSGHQGSANEHDGHH
jgi:hypothetical protein